MGFFRETGRPNSSRVANHSGTGTPAFVDELDVPSDKQVIIYDITTSLALALSDTIGPNVVMYVEVGNCNLTSPISFPKGSGVVLDLASSANVTITYDIV
jgi:hypothetical protein